MIINATNIGSKINGIGRYSLYLSKYFLKNYSDAKIYINSSAKIHFNDYELQKINIVNNSLSPDNGLKGHISRLIWTNKFIKEPIFNTSQLELSFFNKNQIVTVHDIIPLHFKDLHKRQYHYFKYILPKVLNNVKKVITVSNHTKEQLIDFYNLNSDKIEVIYNGIEQIKYREHQREDYILYVGRASETKNISRLIKSYCLCKKKYGIKEKLKLVGVNREDLKSKMGCQGVEYLGYIDDLILNNIYKKAKMFFFPSLYEGFGYPILEAMSYGIPVITSNISSIPEITKDSAILINPYNINEMAENLYKVLNNNNLQKKLSISGLQRVKEFNWEKSAKKHLEILKEIL